MNAWIPLWAALAATSPPGARGPAVTIEKATVPWSELVRLLSREGERPERLAPDAPRAWAIGADVSGTVENGRCTLTLQLRVDVLAGHWTVVPLVPRQLAIAHAQVEGPHRHMLARDANGVALVAEGEGHYTVELQVEGALEAAPGGDRLALSFPGITGGTAHLVVRGAEKVAGRSGWRPEVLGDGALAVDAVLGEGGMELVVPRGEARTEAGGALEELEARTVVSLAGSGATRIALHATPSTGGALELELPTGARLWKVYVNGAPLEAAALARGTHVRIPLRGPARVELAYNFDLPPLGIRGRYHVELPRWSGPVRGARWQLYLPTGLQYAETQASLATAGECPTDDAGGRIALPGQGVCLAFGKPVLTGVGYAEGSYVQPL